METTYYHCSAEHHFARLKGRGKYFASLLYSFGFHLSKKSGCFYASIPRLAEYFGVDEKTIRKALQSLEGAGFFVVVAKPVGHSVKYKPIPHTEWKERHPGRCVEKATMPWSEEPQDELGKLLYAISGGRFRPFPNFVAGMRNTKHNDAAIAEHFRKFLETYLPRHKKWAVGLAGQFIQYLQLQHRVNPALGPGERYKAAQTPKYVGVSPAPALMLPAKPATPAPAEKDWHDELVENAWK